MKYLCGFYWRKILIGLLELGKIHRDLDNIRHIKYGNNIGTKERWKTNYKLFHEHSTEKLLLQTENHGKLNICSRYRI